MRSEITIVLEVPSRIYSSKTHLGEVESDLWSCKSAQKKSTETPYFIKPDLTPPERHMGTALLKQRWSLINTCLNRSCIKIREYIFVKGKLHANYWDHQLIFSNPYASTPLTSNQTSINTRNLGFYWLYWPLSFWTSHLLKIFPFLQPLPLQWISHDYPFKYALSMHVWTCSLSVFCLLFFLQNNRYHWVLARYPHRAQKFFQTVIGLYV